MRKNNKQVTTYFILFSLLLIGVVYAILQANLQINGTAKIGANTWDIHFNNIQVNENSVAIGSGDSAATIDPNNNCKVDFEVTLSIPGDFYEFTIDVVNAGTIDGMIGELNKILKVNNEVVSETPDYLTYSVTYADGMEIQANHKLSAGITETYKVRLEFKTDIEELPDATTIITSLEPQYLQADSSSVVRPNVFIYGTWDQIVDAYSSGNLTSLQTAMEAGMTRDVYLDMDYDGTYEKTAHLRIANLSKPAECSTAGFSQTACGLVLEFTAEVGSHRINQSYITGSGNGYGVKGGWKYSDVRAYINGGKYLEGLVGEIDYSAIGIYDTFPNDLKNVIIDTLVVSGHGNLDSVNFTTIDKLYLIDVKELYGTSVSNTNYTASAYERQLDYYSFYNVSLSSGRRAIKENGIPWWLRSALNGNSNYYPAVNGVGGLITNNAEYPHYSISPAFRIAE